MAIPKLLEQLKNKMNKTNPEGTGSFSLNRAVDTETGEYSFAEGEDTRASGRWSHAEGYNTYAIGNISHAEGYNSVANGGPSHAENMGIAYNEFSHAEGRRVIASGKASHAEGDYKWQTVQITGDIDATTYTVKSWKDEIRVGAYIQSGHFQEFHILSMIMGIDPENLTITVNQTVSPTEAIENKVFALLDIGAFGDYSHSEGFASIALGDSQHVQGRYNIIDENEEYAHIVGNGNSDGRSNAHTLDWNGNAWFASDVYVGSTCGTHKDDGSEKLVTVSSVATALESVKATSIITGLTIDDWTLGDDNRYYQTINVPGVTADITQVILVDVNLAGTDLDDDAELLEAWSEVAGHNVTQGKGTLTFYAYTAPTRAIRISVGVL